MGGLNFGKGECDKALEKIGAQRRTTKESHAWYVLDGRKLFRITVLKGKGEFGTGTKKSIVNQFHLTNQQFYELHRCTLSAEGYEAKIRQKVSDGIL